MNTRLLFASTCLLLGLSSWSFHLAAVEPLDETGMAEIHFPGLPATATGKSVQIADEATAEAHAHVRKEMIVANETSRTPHSPEPEDSGQQIQNRSLVTYTEITQSNAHVESSLALVVINRDKADNKNHSHEVDQGVNINLSNTVNQVDISNMRSTLSMDDNRGNFAIQSMSVDARIIIKTR